MSRGEVFVVKKSVLVPPCGEPDHPSGQPKSISTSMVTKAVYESAAPVRVADDVAQTKLVHGKICYRTSSCLLINGDSLDPNTFVEPCFDLCVTSPPYNVGISYGSSDDKLTYDEYINGFTQRWLTNAYSWTKDGGRLVVNIGLDTSETTADGKTIRHPLAADVLRAAQQCGWQYRQWINWDEGNISCGHAYGSFRMASAPNVICPDEAIIVFHKGEWTRTKEGRASDLTKEEHKAWFLGRWKFSGESKKRVGHPAPFPLELPRRCIKLFSFIGDTVVDLFCGSATTIIAAAKLGRRAIGVELDPGYCTVAKKRILKELGPRNGDQTEGGRP